MDTRSSHLLNVRYINIFYTGIYSQNSVDDVFKNITFTIENYLFLYISNYGR
jgi:hypothetical protein